MGSGYTNYWGNMWDSRWEWSLKFAWFPRRLHGEFPPSLDGGQWIWFKEYYHGVRVIHGPGLPAILHQYITPQQYLFGMLKES